MFPRNLMSEFDPSKEMGDPRRDCIIENIPFPTQCLADGPREGVRVPDAVISHAWR